MVLPFLGNKCTIKLRNAQFHQDKKYLKYSSKTMIPNGFIVRLPILCPRFKSLIGKLDGIDKITF